MGRVSAILFCLLVVGAPLLAHPASAAAQAAYQWTDGQGVVHFTDDLSAVPEGMRDQARTVPMPEASPRPAPPAGSVAPSVEGSAAVREDPPATPEHETCAEKVLEAREKLEKSLARDRALLEDLTRKIHRSTTSRQKNEMQKLRVDVKKRIDRDQQSLETEIPRMEEECLRKKPYVP